MRFAWVGAVLFAVGCAGPSAQLRGGLRGDDLLKVARGQIGAPYRYASADPDKGFDCAGLVWYSFKKLGVSVPRSTSALFMEGSKVSSKKLLPGDLVFYDIVGGGVSHVGIYSREGHMVHAPSTGGKVSEVDIGIRYWTKRYAGARRLD